jgi:dihydroorotate dehydrogenase
VCGIEFKNPLGLGAGFDKDARLTQILPSLGFGYEEIGSITGQPCKGNAKPRLWRLVKSQSIVVYYGLNNLGCNIIYDNLLNKKFSFPVGISIAKTNSPDTVDLHDGVADYLKAYKRMESIGDYVTINISCPNAYGGQPFTDKKSLDELLSAIINFKKSKPIFIKLSPDLSKDQILDIIALSDKYELDGFICSNLTKKRDFPEISDENIPDKGGLSGKVVEKMANEMIKFLYREVGDKFVIVGCGGIFTASDAYKKIKLGASLLQMVTGLIFKGPHVVSEINRGLVELLKADGLSNISEAIGVDNKK